MEKVLMWIELILASMFGIGFGLILYYFVSGGPE